MNTVIAPNTGLVVMPMGPADAVPAAPRAR